MQKEITHVMIDTETLRAKRYHLESRAKMLQKRIDQYNKEKNIKASHNEDKLKLDMLKQWVRATIGESSYINLIENINENVRQEIGNA